MVAGDNNNVGLKTLYLGQYSVDLLNGGYLMLKVAVFTGAIRSFYM